MANFINPYNFIPMGKKKGKVSREGGKLSGRITYILKTKTPLFIPNISCDTAFAVSSHNPGHKSYDFFSYHNLSNEKHGDKICYRPVIPGSEVRGMFRSNYEILTDSCLSSLDSDMQLSKRTTESFKPGILVRKDDTYELYQAKAIRWRLQGATDTNWKKWEYQEAVKKTLGDHKECDRIYLLDKERDLSKIVRRTIDDSIVTSHYGYLSIGEFITRKKMYIFLKKQKIK